MGRGAYRDEGVVLRTYKLGEADRIVVFMTQQHGKIRAVAKGVRKTKSKFGARLEPASQVNLALYEGRGELQTVSDAEIIESNRELREGFGLYTHTVPMLEAVDQVAQDHEPDPPLYRMLTRALRTLDERRTPLVTTAFFWKLLSHSGFEPRLDACARCEAEEPLRAFSVEAGGVLCRDRSARPLATDARRPTQLGARRRRRPRLGRSRTAGSRLARAPDRAPPPIGDGALNRQNGRKGLRGDD
jgi:DNA repair protein RecO (recombination protein O)